VAAFEGATPEGPAILAGCALGPGVDGGDLLIQLSLAPGAGPEAAQEVAGQVGATVMAELGDRLRRGVAVALTPLAG
jgi:hypothetical protein